MLNHIHQTDADVLAALKRIVTPSLRPGSEIFYPEHYPERHKIQITLTVGELRAIQSLLTDYETLHPSTHPLIQQSTNPSTYVHPHPRTARPLL